MSLQESYYDRTFLVADPDARIRVDGDLLKFAAYAAGEGRPAGAAVGDFKRIREGTRVKVQEISIVPAGSKAQLIFARATSEDGGVDYGWTSTRNFKGKFRNVTLGQIEPEAGAGRYSPTARWQHGRYLGQASLVLIVDAALEIERLTDTLVGHYFDMVEAADSDSVSITINSGFRTYPEQKHLYDSWSRHLPGYNLAAKPGYSNHQNGIAIDIPVAGGDGDPRYNWLAQNATAFGFIRTVKTEAWHWEYRPDEAGKARQRGSHKTWA